jgi:peptide chain release factor 1
LEIRFGAGGDDSKQFVDELFAAYTQYAKRLNLQVEILTVETGHMAARIFGPGAAEAFKHEAGKHCVQRIPDNSRGKKQTSIIVVGVLPVRDEPGFTQLPDSEIEIETCGGHGPGGQHQNATDSAVRMKHVPTGTVVFINGRDQQYNRRMARKILTTRVNQQLKAQSDAAYAEIRREQLGDGDRTDKIRTYNFLQSRVVDHRYNVKTGNIKGIMRGQFELLFPKAKESSK